MMPGGKNNRRGKKNNNADIPIDFDEQQVPLVQTYSTYSERIGQRPKRSRSFHEDNLAVPQFGGVPEAAKKSKLNNFIDKLKMSTHQNK